MFLNKYVILSLDKKICKTFDNGEPAVEYFVKNMKNKASLYRCEQGKCKFLYRNYDPHVEMVCCQPK